MTTGRTGPEAVLRRVALGAAKRSSNGGLDGVGCLLSAATQRWRMSFQWRDGYAMQAGSIDCGLDQVDCFCILDELADVRSSDGLAPLGHAHADWFDEEPAVEHSRARVTAGPLEEG